MQETKKNLYLSSLIFLAFFSISIFKIYESDAFWHLKSGEYIVKNLTIPSTDPFTINGESKRWVNTYWLFEVISYTIFKLTGFTGLILFKAILSGTIFTVIFNALLLTGASPSISFTLIIPFLAVFRERLLVRPDLFSYLFISFYFYIYFLFKYREKNKLHFLPIVMLFWTNLHSGAFFGVILLFSFLAGELLTRSYSALKKGERIENVFARLKHLTIFSILSLVIFFISPANFHSIQYLFSQLNVRELVDISEFRPLTEPENRLLLVIALFLFIVLFASFRRLPLSMIIAGFVFLIPGIMTRRMSYYAFIVNIPSLVLFVNHWRSFSCFFKIPEFFKILLCTLWAGTVLFLKIDSDPYHYSGFGVRNIYFPEGHVRYLKKNKLNVNLFNTLNIGGGIIFSGYPEIKAFVDTRIQVNEATLKEIKNSMQSPFLFKSLLEKYNINALLVENKSGLITNGLISTEEWALVYWDDYSMLLLKKNDFLEFAKEHEIKIINPETIVLDLPGYLTNDALTERVIFHLKRSIAINPDCYTAYYSLAYLLNRKDKKLKDAAFYLDRAYRIEPDYIPTLYEIANLYASLRDFYNALYFYKKIIHLERFYKITLMYPTIYKEIGMVYLNLGKKGKAKKYLKKHLTVQPFDSFVLEQLNNLE